MTSSSISADKCDELRRQGWTKFRGAGDPIALESMLLHIGEQLGQPVSSRVSGPLCQTLRPTDSAEAPFASLSRIHSTGSFPLHTDTAHWVTPCRYLILGCQSPGSAKRPTLLLDLRTLPLIRSTRSKLLSEPFQIRNGRSSFFGTILSKDREFARYDPGCMYPIDDSGRETLELLAGEHWTNYMVKIEWSEGDVLIIDNWRCLHGRANAEHPDPDRILRRVSVR